MGDAFDAGVEPGGLRSKSDIRILVCYLLNGAGAPLSREDIVAVMQENGLANYFETMDAIEGLLAVESISRDPEHPDFCVPNDKTKEISMRLTTMLPPSVRERAVNAAVSMLAAARREKENRVEIEETEQGYRVICHISGGEVELLSFSLYVPDREQAKLVKRNFLRDPEKTYRTLLSLLTGNQL